MKKRRTTLSYNRLPNHILQQRSISPQNFVTYVLTSDDQTQKIQVMKYSTEILIHLPRERVVELFNSEENLHKWQPELVSFEHISGEKGKAGAQSRLKYKMGKREMEMMETITRNNLPDEFTGTYEAKGVINWVNNKFEAVDDRTTRWICENEFQFKGFMVLMGWLMPGAFRKQSMKYMEQFKQFAESAG